MTNILILDDMEIRHKRFKEILQGHNLFHAYSFFDAQYIILNNNIEMACLDHDLSDEDTETASFYYDGYGRKHYYNGQDFAHWLSQQEDKVPPRIFIHSWNPEGATKMYFILSCNLRVKQIKQMEFKGATNAATW
jgi:hypothetical protein